MRGAFLVNGVHITLSSGGGRRLGVEAKQPEAADWE